MKEKIKNFRFTRKAFAYPYMLFLLVFVVTPLVLILANAFIYDGKFSFKNFAIFFTEKSSLVVLGNSILVGLLSPDLLLCSRLFCRCRMQQAM